MLGRGDGGAPQCLQHSGALGNKPGKLALGQGSSLGKTHRALALATVREEESRSFSSSLKTAFFSLFSSDSEIFAPVPNATARVLVLPPHVVGFFPD